MRILIIEDEKRLADNLQQYFSGKGYAVDAAYNGLEGEILAESVVYDVIILDLGLPDKDGIQICRYLREKKIKSLIIILTARDMVSERIKGLDSGADDYVGKPFVFQELEARVRAVLRRDRVMDTPKIEIGDLLIDAVNRRVWRDGEEIEIFPKEYAVLEILVHYVNQTVTRIMFEQHAWDLSLDSSSNVVDVYIRKLRVKLDREGQASHIKTIRGTGYRLEA